MCSRAQFLDHVNGVDYFVDRQEFWSFFLRNPCQTSLPSHSLGFQSCSYELTTSELIDAQIFSRSPILFSIDHPIH